MLTPSWFSGESPKRRGCPRGGAGLLRPDRWGHFLLGSVPPLGSWAEDEALPGASLELHVGFSGPWFLNLSSEEVGQSDPPRALVRWTRRPSHWFPELLPAPPFGKAGESFSGDVSRAKQKVTSPGLQAALVAEKRGSVEMTLVTLETISRPPQLLGRLAGARAPSAYLSVHEGVGALLP